MLSVYLVDALGARLGPRHGRGAARSKGISCRLAASSDTLRDRIFHSHRSVAMGVDVAITPPLRGSPHRAARLHEFLGVGVP